MQAYRLNDIQYFAPQSKIWFGQSLFFRFWDVYFEQNPFQDSGIEKYRGHCYRINRSISRENIFHGLMERMVTQCHLTWQKIVF